jgi:hypothetical protein
MHRFLGLDLAWHGTGKTSALAVRNRTDGIGPWSRRMTALTRWPLRVRAAMRQIGSQAIRFS